jgi:hypothetical protein
MGGFYGDPVSVHRFIIAAVCGFAGNFSPGTLPPVRFSGWAVSGDKTFIAEFWRGFITLRQPWGL